MWKQILMFEKIMNGSGEKIKDILMLNFKILVTPQIKQRKKVKKWFLPSTLGVDAEEL